MIAASNPEGLLSDHHAWKFILSKCWISSLKNNIDREASLSTDLWEIALTPKEFNNKRSILSIRKTKKRLSSNEKNPYANLNDTVILSRDLYAYLENDVQTNLEVLLVPIADVRLWIIFFLVQHLDVNPSDFFKAKPSINLPIDECK